MCVCVCVYFFSPTKNNLGTMTNQVIVIASKPWLSKYYFPQKAAMALWEIADPDLGKEKYRMSLEDWEAFKECQLKDAPNG